MAAGALTILSVGRECDGRTDLRAAWPLTDMDVYAWTWTSLAG